jgi:hypothetical protein
VAEKENIRLDDFNSSFDNWNDRDDDYTEKWNNEEPVNYPETEETTDWLQPWHSENIIPITKTHDPIEQLFLSFQKTNQPVNINYFNVDKYEQTTRKITPILLFARLLPST